MSLAFFVREAPALRTFLFSLYSLTVVLRQKGKTSAINNFCGGLSFSHCKAEEKMVQNKRTEPKGYPKAYVGTPRGEVRLSSKHKLKRHSSECLHLFTTTFVALF